MNETSALLSPSLSKLALEAAVQIDPLRLGHLPLVMDVFKRLNLVGIIDQAAPVHGTKKASSSSCVAVLMCGIFVGAHTLWRIRERLKPYDMRTIMQDPQFDLQIYNDERLSEVLDALHLAGLDGIMTQVAIEVIKQFHVSTQYISFDTTSVITAGAYDRVDAHTRLPNVAAPPLPARGYSKEHRGDANQLVFGSFVSQDRGAALCSKSYNGNTADSSAAVDMIGRIREFVAEPREVCCVADCKSWTGEVLELCQRDGLRLLSRLPRNLRLHDDLMQKSEDHPTTYTTKVRNVHASLLGETKVCDTYTYWGFDAEESFTIEDIAPDGSVKKRQLIIPVRALRVHSSALERLKRSAWDKASIDQSKRLTKQMAGWHQMAYACEIDAQRAADRIVGQNACATATLSAKVVHHLGPARRGRGRPPKHHQSEPALDAKEHWKVCYTIAAVDNAVKERDIKNQSTYILIRNVRVGWDISDEDMIVHYKLQHHVERGFSWLVAAWQGHVIKEVRILFGKPLATGPISSLGDQTVTPGFMRRQESTRGPSGAGNAAAKTISLETETLWKADGFSHPAGNSTRGAMGEPRGTTPGSQVGSSVTLRGHGNQGDPSRRTWHSACGGCATGAARVKSKRTGMAWWKSELRVRATMPGNAGGAKAQRLQDRVTGEHGPDTEPGDP